MKTEMTNQQDLKLFYDFTKWTSEVQNSVLNENGMLIDSEPSQEGVFRLYYISGIFVEQLQKTNGTFENIPYKQGYKPSQFFDYNNEGKLKPYLFKDSSM